MTCKLALKSPKDWFTKIPGRQGLFKMFPSTTSWMTPVPPALLAMSSKFLLRSRPIVQTSLGRSTGSGRYFPFPVPESSPIHPVVRLERKLEIIGHGYLDICLDIINMATSMASSPYISSTRNVRQSLHRSYVHFDLHTLLDHLRP